MHNGPRPAANPKTCAPQIRLVNQRFLHRLIIWISGLGYYPTCCAVRPLTLKFGSSVGSVSYTRAEVGVIHGGGRGSHGDGKGAAPSHCTAKRNRRRSQSVNRHHPRLRTGGGADSCPEQQAGPQESVASPAVSCSRRSGSTWRCRRSRGR